MPWQSTKKAVSNRACRRASHGHAKGRTFHPHRDAIDCKRYSGGDRNSVPGFYAVGPEGQSARPTRNGSGVRRKISRAISGVTDWIEDRYSRRSWHSLIGQVTPVEFEMH